MSGATREGTEALAARFRGRGRTADAYRILGKTGLTVSALGFGAYRVDDHTPEHREALEQALSEGCNLIDTSTNYTDGGSETCIGEVLEGRAKRGEFRREETVIVSKIGYVQGQNLELARGREQAGDPFPGMVKISEGCWHCIHPRFLEDQLGRSLSRLKLDRLDACLLHNPEYFLEDSHRHGGKDPEAERREFYARIREAFAHLEEEVKRGRIAWYGVSSNTFGMPPENSGATSLGRMLEAAREAAAEKELDPGTHHFAVAQLPMNFFEHSPLTVKKEGPAADRSTLAFAAESGVGVLVNRPLNAFAHGGLIRLADCAARSQERSDRVASLIDPGLPSALRGESLSRKALHVVASLEGVTCVLTGMRHPLYVEDSMQILNWDRLPAAADLFGKL
jgi:hypothetical protein